MLRESGVSFILFVKISSVLFILIQLISADEEKKDAYESLKKKSVLDYTDADIERLYDQWEVGVYRLRVVFGIETITDTHLLPQKVFILSIKLAFLYRF